MRKECLLKFLKQFMLIMFWADVYITMKTDHRVKRNDFHRFSVLYVNYGTKCHNLNYYTKAKNNLY